MSWSFQASVEAAGRMHREEGMLLACFADRLGVRESQEFVALVEELDLVRSGAEGRGESEVLADLRERALRRGA